MTRSARTVLAAVPVKDLVNAKQRLMPALGARRAPDLAAAMLEDVLDALDAAWTTWRCTVVTTRPRGRWRWPSRRGPRASTESANRGHTAAVAARPGARPRERGVAPFLTIPGDVPCVTGGGDPRAPRRAAAAPRRRPSCPRVRLRAPTARCWRRPTRCRSSSASPRSPITWPRRARAVSTPTVLELPGLGLDVDAPEDLRLLLARGPHTARAAACVARARHRGAPAPAAALDRCRRATRSSASRASPRSRPGDDSARSSWTPRRAQGTPLAAGDCSW